MTSVRPVILENALSTHANIGQCKDKQKHWKYCNTGNHCPQKNNPALKDKLDHNELEEEISGTIITVGQSGIAAANAVRLSITAELTHARHRAFPGIFQEKAGITRKAHNGH